MRRGSSNLVLAAVVAVVLMAVPIVYACVPYELTLAGPSTLLLLPGTVIIRPLEASPDLPLLVFANWVFYTGILWPIFGAVRGSR